MDFLNNLKIIAMIPKRERSKYWETMVDILDGQFPKHECKERGQALVMLSYMEMMLQGIRFGENGIPIIEKKHKTLEQQIVELWKSRGLEVIKEVVESLKTGEIKWTIIAKRKYNK